MTNKIFPETCRSNRCKRTDLGDIMACQGCEGRTEAQKSQCYTVHIVNINRSGGRLKEPRGPSKLGEAGGRTLHTRPITSFRE